MDPTRSLDEDEGKSGKERREGASGHAGDGGKSIGENIGGVDKRQRDGEGSIEVCVCVG